MKGFDGSGECSSTTTQSSSKKTAVDKNASINPRSYIFTCNSLSYSFGRRQGTVSFAFCSGRLPTRGLLSKMTREWKYLIVFFSLSGNWAEDLSCEIFKDRRFFVVGHYVTDTAGSFFVAGEMLRNVVIIVILATENGKGRKQNDLHFCMRAKAYITKLYFPLKRTNLSSQTTLK